MDRRRILLVVAVLVAALGSALVFLYTKGADTRAEKKFDTVQVLEATAIINPGEKFEDAQTAGKLALKAVSGHSLQRELPRGLGILELLARVDDRGGLEHLDRVELLLRPGVSTLGVQEDERGAECGHEHGHHQKNPTTIHRRDLSVPLGAGRLNVPASPVPRVLSLGLEL